MQLISKIIFAHKTKRKFKYITLENFIAVLLGIASAYSAYKYVFSNVVDYVFSLACEPYHKFDDITAY